MQQEEENHHNGDKRLGERSVSQASLVSTSSSKQLFKIRKRKSFDVLRRSSSDISDLDLSLDIVDSGYSENDSSLPVRHEEHSETIKTVSRLKRSISGKFRYNSKISVETTTLVSNEGFHKHIRQGITVKSLHKLLKRVSDINSTDSKGQSALHVCISRGMTDCAKLLIRKGSNVNLQDKTGFTPLHCGALERQIGACKLLLESRGIDVTITTNENANVLHYLVRNPVDEENVVAYRRVLDLLVEKGLDVNKGNMHDEAPIHFSCMKGNTHTSAFLLERGADCNLRTAVGETPLHYAIRSGSLKLVRMLMENGANPTALGEDNATPLEVAEQYQNTDVLDCLQAIIEEELVTEVNSSLMSPRVRINESTIHREGWLGVFYDDSWHSLFTVVNNQRMICYQNYTKNLQVKFSIGLTKSSVIRQDPEAERWKFSISSNSGAEFLFAVESEESYNEWVSSIEAVLVYRAELCKLYDKLKALSKPRESLRSKERKLAHKYFLQGSERLLSFHSPQKLGRWITTHIEVAAACLSETVNIDDELFIQSMVKYFLQRGLFVKFMKAAITHEIRKTTMGETLFREMSLATRMLSSYLDMEEGRLYLQNTVLGLVNAIIIACQDSGLEINPYLITDSHAQSLKLKGNLEKILELSQIFLDKVLSSATVCPLIFRELMLHTRNKVDQVFPNMTHAVVGGFVFLRFLCPAIVTPDKFGLLTRRPDSKVLRIFVLITKLLQSVSNGVEFDGSKEEYMQKLNPFIKRNRLYVTVFFDNLTDPRNIKKQKQASRDLNTMHDFIDEDLAQIYEKTIYDQITKLKPKIVALLSSPVPFLEDRDEDDEITSVEEDID